MTSNAFVSHPVLFDGDGRLIASGPYWCDVDNSPCSGTASVRALLSAGDYVVGANGFTYDIDGWPEGGAVGPYVLSSTLVPEDVTGCSVVFIVRGVTTAQRIDTTDCAVAIQSSSYFSDRFRIQLTARQTYTISMSSADFDTVLFLESGPFDDAVALNNDFGGSSNSQITYTPTMSGLYVIAAATFTSGSTGAYTLIVQ